MLDQYSAAIQTQADPESEIDHVYCPTCGAAVKDTAQFCRSCGAAQPATSVADHAPGAAEAAAPDVIDLAQPEAPAPAAATRPVTGVVRSPKPPSGWIGERDPLVVALFVIGIVVFFIEFGFPPHTTTTYTYSPTGGAESSTKPGIVEAFIPALFIGAGELIRRFRR